MHFNRIFSLLLTLTLMIAVCPLCAAIDTEMRHSRGREVLDFYKATCRVDDSRFSNEDLHAALELASILQDKETAQFLQLIIQMRALDQKQIYAIALVIVASLCTTAFNYYFSEIH